MDKLTQHINNLKALNNKLIEINNKLKEKWDNGKC